MKDSNVFCLICMFLMAIYIYQMEGHITHLEKENKRVDEFANRWVDIFNDCFDDREKKLDKIESKIDEYSLVLYGAIRDKK